ncbi:hypothetical protein [Rhodanobacter denitrificans]|uniref:Uncharacterized protein n=1 Tax=Rhodanobacter denitrificans TaxID=666685 RepID=M4NEA5_9GAMM|nr:hypothetical protein [Rhodanobacter denitrificans]AGG89130.1 hypothetical protein R2APBS1_2007 [Rhodanobacter denitrificans]UJJ52953.1 hypothetical protein LRK52_18795 [Rhodanobacter denitrificans]
MHIVLNKKGKGDKTLWCSVSVGATSVEVRSGSSKTGLAPKMRLTSDGTKMSAGTVGVWGEHLVERKRQAGFALQRQDDSFHLEFLDPSLMVVRFHSDVAYQFANACRRAGIARWEADNGRGGSIGVRQDGDGRFLLLYDVESDGWLETFGPNTTKAFPPNGAVTNAVMGLVAIGAAEVVAFPGFRGGADWDAPVPKAVKVDIHDDASAAVLDSAVLRYARTAIRHADVLALRSQRPDPLAVHVGISRAMML